MRASMAMLLVVLTSEGCFPIVNPGTSTETGSKDFTVTTDVDSLADADADADADVDVDADADTDTDTHTGGLSDGCEMFGENDCSLDPDCVVVYGYPIVDDTGAEACVDRSAGSTFLGCVSGLAGCGDYPTTAGDGFTCWWFPNTCVPDGWTWCGDGYGLADCP
jgi:hypothetical protein